MAFAGSNTASITVPGASGLSSYQGMIRGNLNSVKTLIPTAVLQNLSTSRDRATSVNAHFRRGNPFDAVGSAVRTHAGRSVRGDIASKASPGARYTLRSRDKISGKYKRVNFSSRVPFGKLAAGLAGTVNVPCYLYSPGGDRLFVNV